MDYVEPMKVSDTTDYLFKITASLWLLNFCMFYNIIKQLTVLHILHDKEQVSTCLDYFIKLDDRWMSNQF